VLCAALGPRTSHAEVTVVFGTSWDATSLQQIVDTHYGPGRINVRTDYIGAHSDDPDPWYWIDIQVRALLVREIAGNANENSLGWYAAELNSPPVLDGVHDGVVFDGPSGPGSAVYIRFDSPAQRFGFYLNPNGPYSAMNAPEPEKFFTNRRWNDIGPDGTIARHAPLDGDVQALIFDVSPWTRPNTWLVCFEDLDSGADVGPCCGSGTDNDFNDLVFEVSATGVTPIEPMTFGSLKSRYR
jgi:hypothetical protein